MVNYVTKQGIVRNFSDICVLSIKTGVVKLVQDLETIKNGVSYYEKRFSETILLPGENREKLVNRLNDDCNVVINNSGNLVTVKGC